MQHFYRDVLVYFCFLDKFSMDILKLNKIYRLFDDYFNIHYT